MKKFGIRAASAAVISLTCCSPAELQQAERTASDIGNARETICALVERFAASTPDLEPARAACAGGESLRAVAAAYAGCQLR